MADILKTDDLRAVTGYTRASDVERCLHAQGVRFFWGKNGPWTTINLIDAAGGLVRPDGGQASNHYPADVIPEVSP